MTALTLHRVKQTTFATYGELRDATGFAECVTIELPWKDNAHDVSCVPPGAYTAERYLSPKHGYVLFRLIDVPQRDDVEIHIANLPCDLLGCIGVGQRFGYVEKPTGEKGDGVLASHTAFQAFMANHPEQRFTLTVTDPPLASV